MENNKNTYRWDCGTTQETKKNKQNKQTGMFDKIFVDLIIEETEENSPELIK